MINTDFVYDGKSLSSYGFIICDFEASDGVSEVDTGSVLTFNKTPMNKGQYHALTSSNYEQCFNLSFDICKDPDIYGDDDYMRDNLMDFTNVNSTVKKGVTFAVDKKNGTITANGTATNGDAVMIIPVPSEVYGDLYLTGCPKDGKENGVNKFVLWANDDATGSRPKKHDGSTVSEMLRDEDMNTEIQFIQGNTNQIKIAVYNGVTANNAVFSPTITTYKKTLGNRRIITDSECADIIKWLNRKGFYKFNFVNNNTCYFDASFNVNKITINGELYGLRLTMETNRPFGYGSLVTETKTYDSNNTSYTIENKSQELGYTYPTIKVKATQAGNITITNETTQTVVTINNLSVNETVEIDGLAQTIKTSKSSHKIANDFNYEFLPLQNSLSSGDNVITATPCTLTITYSPIIKNIKL